MPPTVRGGEVAVDGCFNLRDAGGWPVGDDSMMATGRLYRGDDPVRLTPPGRAAVDELGLAAVIDLRQPGRTKQGLGFIDESRRQHRPLVDRVIDTAEPPAIDQPSDLVDLYESMLEIGREPIAGVIDSIAHELVEGPVLVHCAYGKDRTGLIVALVQAAIGCDVASLVAEYALTDAPALQRTAWLMQYPLPGDTDLSTLPPMLLRAPAEAMTTLLERVLDRYGSLTAWVDSFPLAPDTVSRLRGALVVPSETASP